jgi:hypothetical protein
MSPTHRFFSWLVAIVVAIPCLGWAQTAGSPQTTVKEHLGPRFAFVCLASDRLPAPGVFEAKLAQYLKIDPTEIGKLETITDRTERTDPGLPVSSVKIGKNEVLIARAPFPIPKADIDYACGNSVFWPKAAEEMAKSKSHLIVTVLGDFASALGEGLFLTRVIAACLESYDAIGVYWEHATVVHSPEFFLKYAKSASAEDPPVLLWVGFLRSQGEKEGTTSLFTRGLHVIGRMEIEVVDSQRKPSEIFERVVDLSSYLLKKGNVIGDGQAIPSAGAEKIMVRHVDSVLDRKGTVLRIELE